MQGIMSDSALTCCSQSIDDCSAYPVSVGSETSKIFRVMKTSWSVLVLVACLAGEASAQEAQRSQVNTNRAGNRPGRDPQMDALYKLGPDSMRQERVPEGRFDGPKVI